MRAGRLVVGLAENFLVAEFSLSELFLDFFRVVLAFLDTAAAFVQHLENRSEGIFLQHPVNEEEKNDLGDEFAPGNTKSCKNLHKIELAANRESSRDRPDYGDPR